MDEFDCHGNKQAISFTCSIPIILQGIIVYGCLEGSYAYQVKVEMIEEERKQSTAEPVKDAKGKQLSLKPFKDGKGKQLDLAVNKDRGELPVIPDFKKELETAEQNGGAAADAKGKRLNMTYLTLETERTTHTYDVMFSKSVEILAGKYYSVSLEMDGPPTKKGIHGISEVMSEDVLFHFYSVKGNRTSVEKGQIPGLLFTLPGSKPRLGK